MFAALTLTSLLIAPLPQTAEKVDARRSRDRQVVLDQINSFRRSRNLPVVTTSKSMQRHVQQHAKKIQQAMLDPTKHKRKSGKPLCWQLDTVKKQYTFCLACCQDDSVPWAEVVAWQQRRPQDAVKAWTTSKAGHAELLTRGREVGIGIVYDSPKGPLWVVMLR